MIDFITDLDPPSQIIPSRFIHAQMPPYHAAYLGVDLMRASQLFMTKQRHVVPWI